MPKRLDSYTWLELADTAKDIAMAIHNPTISRLMFSIADDFELMAQVGTHAPAARKD